MLLNTSNPADVIKAKEHFNKLMSTDCKFELKKILNTRSTRQNSALHLFFTFVSTELNSIGLEFVFDGLKVKGMSSRYTPLIVKEFIWKPIQIAMFDFNSTTKLSTNQMNEIIDVITKYFGDKGIVLIFPSIEKLIN